VCSPHPGPWPEEEVVKRIQIALIACFLMGLAATAASANTSTPRVDRREWRQHQRIRQGWRSGELTRGERFRLQRGQRHVRRMEWRAKRDGRVGPMERRRLARAQNHQSRAIYRLKHNRRSRVL
jgi:hypothetical protein